MRTLAILLAFGFFAATADAQVDKKKKPKAPKVQDKKPVTPVGPAKKPAVPKNEAAQMGRLIGAYNWLKSLNVDVKNWQSVKFVLSLDLSGRDIPDGDLRHLKAMPRLQSLTFIRTRGLTSESWKSLSQVPTLRALTIQNVTLSAGDLDVLRHLRALETLDLKLTGIRGPDLKSLAGLASLKHIRIHGIDGGDDALKNIAGSASAGKILTLRLTETMITGQSMADLRKLTEVRDLALGSVSALQGPDYNALEALTKLNLLTLQGPHQLKNNNMAFFQRLTALTEVNLMRNFFSDQNFAALTTNLSKGIRKLDVRYGHMTGSELSSLAAFTKLEILGIGDNPLTKNAIVEIGKLKSLKQLGLGNLQDRIRDAEFAPLANLTSLTTLALYNCSLSDAGLVHLEKLTGLLELNIRDTNVTAGGKHGLKAKLPNCHVTWN